MKKKIYKIIGLDLNQVVEKHIELLNPAPQQELVNWYDIPTSTDQKFIPVYKIVETRKKKMTPPPRKSILYNKYRFLLHIIITRCYNAEKGVTTLNSAILKSVLGSCYKDMLTTLVNMQIVQMTNYYQLGETARKLSLCSDIQTTHEEIYTNTIDKYFDKMNLELRKYEHEQEKQQKRQLGNKFYQNYLKSLKLLSISHIQEAHYLIDNKEFQSDNAKKYYQQILNKYTEGNFSISCVDNNKRIYSILTSTPRELKNFLNIKFQIDIKNSHPLLFCNYIIKYFDINNNILNFIYNINNNTLDYSHNVGKQLCKMLKNSNIDTGNIPCDIIEYIYKTSNGEFWDDFKDSFQFFKRSEVKILLFREIFYSKSLTLKNKIFGTKFKEHYPNVYKFIRMYRKSDTTKTKLANSMMRLESDLFQSILSKLYCMKFKAINIHDAIIILDTPENTNCSTELVTSIIKNVYSKHLLSPSVSIDYFTSNYAKAAIKKAAADKEAIQAKFNDLQIKANNPSHPEYEDSTKLLQLIKEGNWELIVEDNEVVFHLLL